jgi:hypothetical protein
MTSIVIGDGSSALIGAAALGVHGATTLLLQGRTAQTVEAQLPLHGGRFRSTQPTTNMETCLGPAEPLNPSRTFLYRDQEARQLPLSMTEVHRLFRSQKRTDAARGWLRARVRNATSSITGNFIEERSYRDWIVRRMGHVAYEELYSSYALSRWGRDGSELSASLARRCHYTDAEENEYCLSGELTAPQLARAACEKLSVSIEEGIDLLSLCVEDGRVSAVETSQGMHPVEGPLFIALPPQAIVRLLGDACSTSIRVDCGYLKTIDACQWMFKSDRTWFDEIHVVDSSSPIQRIVHCPQTGWLLVDLAYGASKEKGPVLRELAKMGVDGLDSAPSFYRTLSNRVPIWHPLSHFRLRRVLSQLHSLGIQPIGGAGLFTEMELNVELDILDRLALDFDYLDVFRELVEPPVRVPDLDARITRFVER